MIRREEWCSILNIPLEEVKEDTSICSKHFYARDFVYPQKIQLNENAKPKNSVTIHKNAATTAALKPGTVILNPSLTILKPKEVLQKSFTAILPAVIPSPSFVFPQTQTNILSKRPTILKIVRSKPKNYLNLDQIQNPQSTAAQVV